MPTTLILFASTHGQTAKVAGRVADHLRAAGHDVTMHRGGDGTMPEPSGFDLVIVGASVHAGHHQRLIIDWVKTNRPLLDQRPSAFFSVSLSAAEDTAESRESTAKLISDFAQETGWTPRATAAIAGALQNREYDFFTRLLMRAIARARGQSTDAHEDIEYTDWDGVERFAAECDALGRVQAATS